MPQSTVVPQMPRPDDIVSERARGLRPMKLLELLMMARSHGALDLATGSPSLPVTSRSLIDAAVDALRGGHNQYADTAGIRGLRERAAKIHGADAETEITITAGSTEALNTALQTFVDPGDEVVVFDPSFESYATAVRLAGGTCRFVGLSGKGWTWHDEELESAFGPRTKAVIVNSPHNPTGRVFSAAELDRIAQLCEQWNCVVISDEVYADTYFDGIDAVLPSSHPAFAGRVLGIRSMSKSHAVSGWRIGWIYAAPPLTAPIRLVHETLTTGVCAPLQTALSTAPIPLAGMPEEDLAKLAANREKLLDVLTGLGFECTAPEGGSFMVCRIPDHVALSAEAFCRAMITDTGVATAPGSMFFADPACGDDLIRLSFNKSPEVVDQAVSRLAASRLLKKEESR